ncbi:MAG: RND transporter [Bacteroidetes bacterium]|nr:RND transporter [Bacteroidota bacterium]
MWLKIAKGVLKYRWILLSALILFSSYMAIEASKVKLSYDFARAIPTDHPKYQQYLDFKKTFGEDGNLLTIGFQSDSFFTLKNFNANQHLQDVIQKINGVEDIISVERAVYLARNDSSSKLVATRIFPAEIKNQVELDSLKHVFLSLPFYRGLIYNPATNAYLMGIRINKEILGSKERERTVGEIEAAATSFSNETKLDLHLSGLPLIRTNVAIKIANEMKWFLLGSLALSALILFIFFRSLSTVMLSLGVVIIGVIYSLASIHMLGYKITLLTALIPPLIVVIGIPNCIYFLNKFHASYIKTGDKKQSIVDMISKMGVVTLFCNISAALGFAVFALTKSVVLKEFGVVAGINIMLLFFITIILVPISLYYMKAPKSKHVQYLYNKWLLALLTSIEKWVFAHQKMVYIATAALLIVSIAGIFKLKTQSFIVDDLPKEDRIYTDLRFFETHFKGIMPLEIIVDTKRKNGIAGTRALTVYEKVDAYSQQIASHASIAKPLSLAEGLKFAKQAFYDGDSNNYSMPNAFDGAFLADYMKPGQSSNSNGSSLQKLMSSFVDSNRQTTRISVNMADLGSEKMPMLIDSLQKEAYIHFDSTKYNIHLTGSSITFLEGSIFIIQGLKESILWAFLFISLCMLYLFKNLRILVCSLIPNLIPLVMTAGLMGWVGINIKPSTVLVFSVALGIAIDITIRFLVNFKQELPVARGDIKQTVVLTIRDTGISIVYTSLVLIAGFIIFAFSGFGSTQALGWLTSFTLYTATLTNLILLPVILVLIKKLDIN